MTYLTHAASDCKIPLDGGRSNPGETLTLKGRGCSSSRVQIKDSGLTKGVDDETSSVLAVKLSLRMHSRK